MLLACLKSNWDKTNVLSIQTRTCHAKESIFNAIRRSLIDLEA
jgi:hypothetical protein